MKKIEQSLNIVVIAISGIALLAAFLIQYMSHEKPCAFCFFERLTMLGVSIGCLMNVRFGIRKAHYGLALLASIFGAGISFVQILHSGVATTQKIDLLWNIDLSTWSFLFFLASTIFIILLLIVFDQPIDIQEPKKLNAGTGMLYVCLFILSCVNVFATMPSLNFSGLTLARGKSQVSTNSSVVRSHHIFRH